MAGRAYIGTSGWNYEGRDAHVYFDNDALGHAPRNALQLIALVSKGDGIPARCQK